MALLVTDIALVAKIKGVIRFSVVVLAFSTAELDLKLLSLEFVAFESKINCFLRFLGLNGSLNVVVFNEHI